MEKLEYKLHLISMYTEKFYTDNLKYRAASKTGRTMAKIIDKKAKAWAEVQMSNDIKNNGYPEVNPFLEGYVQTFTLFYTPEIGLTVIPKTEKSIPAVDANEFYNAVKNKDVMPWTCNTIDEAMFDLLNEKYGIDFSSGAQDQLLEHLKIKQDLSV
jgi:hypothetical protein